MSLLQKKPTIVIGERFNRWTIIEDVGRNGDGRRVRVRCDCGDIHVRFFYSIKGGKSPGCLKCSVRPKREFKPRDRSKSAPPEFKDAVIRFKAKPITGSVWEIAFGNTE